MFLFLLFFSFCFCLHAPQPLVVLNDTVLTDIDFYEKISKDEWDSFDVNKKTSVFNDFLKAELGYYDAIQKGVHLNPKTTSLLISRKKQILLNNTYEHLVARPLVNKLEVDKNLENLQNKVEAYHLLIGYKTSKQNTDSVISQKEAKTLIDSLFNVIVEESRQNPLEDVFMSYAKTFSIDPSAKQNSGFLGWVPWGRTVMSFQEPLFSLPIGALSEPIHTEYGYHLVLKKAEGLSSHFYYSEDHYADLAIKLAEGSLPFDSLRTLSSNFDSLMIKNSKLVFNTQNMDSLFLFIEKKQKEKKLSGNKNQIIDWVGSSPENLFLFSFNNKGFGKGWLVSKLKETASSRVPPIKTKKELQNLVLFFVLQEVVLGLGKEQKIEETVSFKRDWINNKKNILYSEYLAFLLNQVSPLDSSLVRKEYEKQKLEKELLKPRRVVFSEIRVFDEVVAKTIASRIKNKESFESLLTEFGGSIKEPVSITRQNPLAVSLFLKKEGEISEIITNKDGSFSIARVERFLEEEYFSLDLVYNKIERDLTSSYQDSIKTFLLDDLINSLSPTINKNLLGL